jgi:dienelactone hydrolase
MHPAIDPRIETVSVREQGLVGTFYIPAAPPPHPVVMTLGGSSGGIFALPAMPLAARGIAVLALAYFGMPSLPKELVRIPLEYFGTAIAWLRRRPDVRPEAIAVAGASRGGELALLLGATFPEIRAVVSWVGSGLVYGAVSSDRSVRPAWTRGGLDLPFAGFDGSAVDWTVSPVRLDAGFLAALPDLAVNDETAIAVERINGPVLLISGTDDHVWPSTRLSDLALRRLRDHRHPHAFEHLAYEGAGHVIGPIVPGLTFSITHSVHPLLGIDFSFGGTPDLNTQASYDSWARIVRMLETRFDELRGSEPG